MNHAISVLVQPARRISGRLTVPGDKSISHRSLLLSALADGASTISNLGSGEDCRSTRACLTRLGVSMTDEPDGRLRVVGRGLGGLLAPRDSLDAGNSGTTTRLMLGILAGHDWPARLVGDESLQRRPMLRIIAPLRLMGARIDAPGDRLPLDIHGGHLTALAYTTPVASAQVKSGILLAALFADGETVLREPAPTRDHTERALGQFGVTVQVDSDRTIRLVGGQRLKATSIAVPGDPSSAAFWAVAAAAVPGSDVVIENVCLNQTRIGFVDILTRAGALVDLEPTALAPEPVGNIRVRYGGVRPFTVTPSEVPGVIDELPALAALATAGGAMVVSGAAELRVKESDRIADLVRGLRALGATADEQPDGFVIDGHTPIHGGTADAVGDHRLAMAFALAGLRATGPTCVEGAGAVDVSYPGFFAILERLRA